ncbi:MAG: hypothetical protein ABI131_04475 [Nostocoides sp.]
MATLLTMFVAMTGGGFVGWGWARYLRGRFRVKDCAAGISARRSGVVMAVGGGLLLLLPEVPSHLLLAVTPSTGVEGAFGALAAWVWRLSVLAVLTVVYGSMALLRERVTQPIREAAERGVAAVVCLLPVGGARGAGSARRMRRMPQLAGFPRDLGSLVAHDQMLTRRLLDYERNLDLGANLPAMRDHSVPATAAAWQAMMGCDALRPTVTPGSGVGVGDVLRTDYGRAVADFGVALAAAEDNARRLATGSLSTGEVAALAEAERLLAFVQSSHTTPAERAAAYDALAQQLGRARPDGHRGTDPGERSHPWLDVNERVLG